jgi:hypothetical protein
MFSYLAFKGLAWNKTHHALLSPVIRAVWNKTITPWGEFFCCEAAAKDLEHDKGIFAASIGEARSYTLQVHLVAPDPRRRIVLGTSGWRAEAAMVVDFMTTDKRAARQILAAYYAGYPQVPGILAWAARYTKFKEGFRILQNILDDCQDEDVLQVVADSAATIGEEGLPILEQLSSSESMWVRMKVIDACSRSAEYVRPLLRRFVESNDEFVRTYAAFACATHGLAALPWLERLARDESCEVRVAVAKSIWRLGEVAISILEELQRDEDIHVRHEASVSFQIVKQDIEFASVVKKSVAKNPNVDSR